LNEPTAESRGDPHSLPHLALFPLQSVLFPGAQLQLRVFEPRYLDLVSRCLREKQPFGVVCLRQGSEVRTPGDEPVLLESTGVLAQLQEVDAEHAALRDRRATATSRRLVDRARLAGR
jgi:Lon protease-like protein